jgi:SAM-dependent methyltransferase
MDREAYIHGYSEAVVYEMQSRTAEAFAGFLIPLLNSGFSMLDCGCGPGTVTAGFRAYLGEGRLVGVDISEEQINIANESVADDANTEFQAADVYNLPFDDDTFDVVFSHTLLEHVSNPVDALVEMKRVLKPGGLIATKNGDRGGQVPIVNSPTLDKAFRLHTAMAAEGGSDMDVGRRQHAHVLSAGFEKVSSTTSTHFYDSEGVKDRFAALARGWCLQVFEAGRLTEDEFQACLGEIDRLEADPSGHVNLAVYWETVGRKGL